MMAHKPPKVAQVALKLDKVYADTNLSDLLNSGSPRDVLLFETRCSLIVAYFTCASLESSARDMQADWLDMALATYGAPKC